MIAWAIFVVRKGTEGTSIVPWWWSSRRYHLLVNQSLNSWIYVIIAVSTVRHRILCYWCQSSLYLFLAISSGWSSGPFRFGYDVGLGLPPCSGAGDDPPALAPPGKSPPPFGQKQAKLKKKKEDETSQDLQHLHEYKTKSKLRTQFGPNPLADCSDPGQKALPWSPAWVVLALLWIFWHFH